MNGQELYAIWKRKYEEEYPATLPSWDKVGKRTQALWRRVSDAVVLAFIVGETHAEEIEE